MAKKKIWKGERKTGTLIHCGGNKISDYYGNPYAYLLKN